MALLCFLFSFRWCPISQLKTIPCTFSEYSSRVKMRNVWVSIQMTMKIHTGWWMSCKCTSQCHGISPSPIIVRLTLRQWSGASWDIHSGRRRSYLLRWVKTEKNLLVHGLSLTDGRVYFTYMKIYSHSTDCLTTAWMDLGVTFHRQIHQKINK